MKKKFILLAYITLILFVLVGCGNEPSNNNNNSSNSSTTSEKSTTEDTNKDDQSSLPIKSENDKKTSERKEKSCRIFYYDINKDKQFYIDKNVEVTDGALVSALTNELKNNTYNNDFVLLSKETNVTSATLDKNEGILKVYFNDSFKNSTNLGTAAEVELITSLVNTYGYNFNVKKVSIYVNGQIYVDPRGEMKNGYFTVDTSKAVEFK